MTTVIVKEVPGSEHEAALGVMVSTPPHYVVAWGEYADQGEADGEVRVMAAVDADGIDITDSVASLVGRAVREWLDAEDEALGSGGSE